MSRYTKRDKYGHAYTNETIYDRGMTSEDGKTYEKHYFENGTSAYDGKPIDRLCELEDKIEQGEMVEVVRCKDCYYAEEMEGLIGGTCLYCVEWCRNVDGDTYCSNGMKLKGGEIDA